MGNPAPPTDPDADLMIAVARGDQTAFAELFDRHLPGVLNALFQYTRDRAAAEDLAQEVFLRVYNARHRYQPQARFTTWLYRIVANLAFNYQRNQKHRRALSLSTPSESSSTDPQKSAPEPADTAAGNAPSDAMHQDELAAAVAAAIAKLPDNQRMAIVLHRYQHFSYQEIADTLELSPDAVKSLLSRARSNLKELLAPLWASIHDTRTPADADTDTDTDADTNAPKNAPGKKRKS